MKRYMLRDKTNGLYYRNSFRGRWVSQELGQLYKNKSGVKSSINGILHGLIRNLPGCPSSFLTPKEYSQFFTESKDRILNERFEIVEFELVEK